MLLTSLKIIGIDYSTGMLTVAKRRAAQAGIHHADFLHCSWEDGGMRFHLVILRSLHAHIGDGFVLRC